MRRLASLIVVVLALSFCPGTVLAQTGLEFGFSKVDVTPEKALRLSGYGRRTEPSEGIDTPLYARAMAMRANDTIHVLVSVEVTGFTAKFTQSIFERLRQNHGLSREQFVITCTHNHTSPHIGLENLFAEMPTDEQVRDLNNYQLRLRDRVVESVGAAIADIKPGRIFTAQGKATFARNRRVLKDGVWTGFGETPGGTVDHSLPVLRITNVEATKTRGLVFNYACHCTTFGGDYNRVNGDWAGYAMTNLEADNEGAVAICTIGCGADSNPQRDEERALELAKLQGKEISSEVERLTGSATVSEIAKDQLDFDSNFGFAGLPIDRPDDKALQAASEDRIPQVRRHAMLMMNTKRRMGRLPETYPMPIQVWRFGDEFAMVFLGGEVVADYAHRIRKEVCANSDLSPDRVWVTAYANDIFGYVASDRMQTEGGYEVDFSQIYYLQPGRWSKGTEQVVIDRVHEMFVGEAVDKPLSVDDALKSFTVPEGWAVDVIAAEPLIRDPINFCVDARGRMWVVEMGDYPKGDPVGVDNSLVKAEREYKDGTKPWDGDPGGCIKVLTDTDRDGVYDRATVFLDSLTFPTGAYPWRDGVIVSGAPDIYFARDTDGDDKCDETTVLYTGFTESNPQHRINGFEYGLDGWLYLAAGTHDNGTITSLKTGKKVETSGRDVRIQPDTGDIEALSGESQYGRCRDERNNWYGNMNYQPLWQFAIEERHLKRNPFVPSPSPRVYLTDPKNSPPVYPTSRTLDRFNDLFTLNRFTSACAPMIWRDYENGRDLGLVCEPVHNLISAIELTQGSTTVGGKLLSESSQREFCSSSDNWFRPVRMMAAPSDSANVLICDMYRQVIEHPEWIPEAWQASLDLYAGSDRGRIYSLRLASSSRSAAPDLESMTNMELVDQLKSKNRWRRDCAQRLLIERCRLLPSNGSIEVENALLKVLNDERDMPCRIQALWTLASVDPSKVNLAAIVESSESELMVQAVRAVGVNSDHVADGLIDKMLAINDSRLAMEVAIAIGENSGLGAGTRQSVLAAIAKSNADDPWVRAMVLSSSVGVAGPLLGEVCKTHAASESRNKLVDGLIATSIGNDSESGLIRTLTSLSLRNDGIEQWQIDALNSCLQTAKRKGLGLSKLSSEVVESVEKSIRMAMEIAADEDCDSSDRASATRLIGYTMKHRDAVCEQLAEFLEPASGLDLQIAAVESLGVVGHVEPLLEVMADASPSLQSRIQSLLLSRKSWTTCLIDAVKEGDVSLDDLTTSTRYTLSEYADQKIRERYNEIASQDATNSDRIAIVEAYREALTLKGDSVSGKKVFEVHCANCHQVDGLGTHVGPDLMGLKDKTTEYVLVAILDPNRAIESKYRSYKIATSDGRFFTGMVLEESATSVKLALADGHSVSILRSDIEEMQSSGLSFMPEGFEKSMTVQQAADLLQFVHPE